MCSHKQFLYLRMCVSFHSNATGESHASVHVHLLPTEWKGEGIKAAWTDENFIFFSLTQQVICTIVQKTNRSFLNSIQSIIT